MKEKLKTLKNIRAWDVFSEGFGEACDKGMINMEDEWVPVRRLKAEAVKWIKDAQKGKKDKYAAPEDWNNGWIAALMDFFDLEEENLK